MTYLPQILALGQEELAICAGHGDGGRLAWIEAERARLWDLQRRIKRGQLLPPEPPTPEPTERPPLPKLPLGVQWVNPERYWPSRTPPQVRPCVWLTRREKVYLPVLPSTEEGIAQAARAAIAGRQARDAGESREEVIAAMREAL